ncbi:hypothetical protein J3R82DRAFT_11012 [Butyriboletus roseoflavus]|nr:hypothetical protein J3R82DRAFT_11012 [Butyriboletus roseoflavus]
MDPYRNHYPWYQTPYNPHVYVPPQYNDPYRQKPPGWHFSDRTQSQPQHPHLNPTLAAGTTNIRYDLRKATRDGILLSTYQQISSQPAFAQPTYDVRIISKAFPWSVDIRAPTGSVVTCSAIFEGLYAMLQEPIVDSEWGIVVHDKSKKETVEKAAKARSEKDRDACLKRIDWLGETTAFKGLERDEEFEKKRLLPGTQPCKETWMIKFGRP